MEEKYKQSEAKVRQLYDALDWSYEILGHKFGYAYEGKREWAGMDTIKAALINCKPDKVAAMEDAMEEQAKYNTKSLYMVTGNWDPPIVVHSGIVNVDEKKHTFVVSAYSFADAQTKVKAKHPDDFRIQSIELMDGFSNLD